MSNFLVPIVCLVVLGLLVSTVSKQARRTTTGFVVQYGLPFKILAISSGVITVMLSVMSIAVSPASKPAVLILLVLFTVISVPLLLMVFFTRVEVEDGFMVVRSPWRRTRRLGESRAS